MKELGENYPLLIGSLSNDNGGDVNENGKKAIGSDWQNSNFTRHAFCTFLCRHCTTTT